MCENLCRTQHRTKLDHRENKQWRCEYQEVKLHFITAVSLGVKTPSMITRVSIISIIASFKALLILSLAMEDPFMRYPIYFQV